MRLCQMIWHTRLMRTTLDLDDALMEALLARHPDASKTDAIETAVRSYLERGASAGLRELAGTLDLEDASCELRGADRTT